MHNILFVARAIPFLLLAACSMELTIDGYSVNRGPVMTLLAPTNGGVVGTNYAITCTVTAADYYTNLTLVLRINNGPEILLPCQQSNAIILSNQNPGYPSLALYTRDKKGRCSATNQITIAVSAPGFTEINAGSLMGVFSSSIALDDLDGDGDPDLIITGTHDINSSTFTSLSKIFQNDGSGGFTEINPGCLGAPGFGHIALGDLDGDGAPDLIQTGFSGTWVSRIFQNDGSGAFTEINAGSLSGASASSIALGDLDGDGDLDLILTGATETSYISKIYRNDGNAAFTEINAGSLTGVYNGSIALGDLDGDGDLDLVLTGATNLGGSARISRIYRNAGNGSFTEINAGSLAGVAMSSIVLGDIDGDGDLDLILTGSTGSEKISRIYQNDGNGALTEINVASLTGAYDGSIALGDLDGDGDLDLVLTGRPVGTGISKVYLNDGSGAFTEINPGSLTSVYDSSIALGDLDGDGDLDLILTGDISSDRGISKIYLNNWNRGGCARYAVKK